MLAPGARDAMIARMELTVLRDPTPLLQRISAPTLLVWGEKDGLIPIANSADYLKAIPNVTLVRLQGFGGSESLRFGVLSGTPSGGRSGIAS